MSLRADLALGKCEGMTIKEIAQKYKVTPSGVRYQKRELEKIGIEVKYKRAREKTKMRNDIRAGKLNGLTKKKIADMYGCTTSAVKDAFYDIKKEGFEVYYGKEERKRKTKKNDNKKTEKKTEEKQNKKPEKKEKPIDNKKYNRCWECTYWSRTFQCCDYLCEVGHSRPRDGYKCNGKVYKSKRRK